MGIIQILVVEDDYISAKIVETSLKNIGYDVLSVVSSGEDALLKIELYKPDLVLMDIVLNGQIDGIETANQIHLKYDIPVVYMTSYTAEEVLDRANTTEPFGYIMKPFDDKELHTAIKIALYKYKMEKRLREREEWYYTTLKCLFDGVITIDKNDYITFINPAAEHLTGWEHKEAEGKKMNEVFKLTDKVNYGTINNSIEKLISMESESGLQGYSKLISKDGREIFIDNFCAPIKDRNGSIAGTVLTFRSIEGVLKAKVDLEKSFFDLAEAISRTIESRDLYTAGHQRRVAELANVVGNNMGFGKERLNELYIGGLLHDIGKITIPMSILSKPAKLSINEFELVKEHSVKGYEIIKKTKLPWDISDIILHHHEKLDGSGYPDGLRGDAICLNVRIVTVCDVVESMATFRPYRPANTKKAVLNELKRYRSIKYDNDVVDLMTRIIISGEFNPWKTKR